MDLNRGFTSTGQTHLELAVIHASHRLDTEHGREGRGFVKNCPKLEVVLGNSCCHIQSVPCMPALC